MLIYGVPGCGKSTLASYAPSPIFLDLENGLKRVDCAKTPKQLTSLAEVLDWLRYLYDKPEYKTIVIDTIDELEKFLAAKVLAGQKDKSHKTIADIPYGRGGDLLVAEWKNLISTFDALSAAGKNILLIGHEQIIKFENPSDANFDYYAANLHKKAVPVVTAKLDAVLFAHFETVVVGADDKHDKGKAIGDGRRMLRTSHGASWTAKNRFNLPAVVPMGKLGEPTVFDLIK